MVKNTNIEHGQANITMRPLLLVCRLMLVARLWLLEGTSLDSSLVSLLAGGRVCAAVGEGK